MRRVAEQIKKDVSLIIGSEMKDPRVSGITSVTDVDVSRDLRYATVYVSIFGSEAEQEETLRTLVGAAGFIRGEIGKRIRLRYTPEINFQLDHSIAYGAHIEEVIRSLKNEESKGKEENKEHDGSGENN